MENKIDYKNAKTCLKEIETVLEENNCNKKLKKIILTGALAYAGTFNNPFDCTYEKIKMQNDKIFEYIPKYLTDVVWNTTLNLLLKYDTKTLVAVMNIIELPKKQEKKDVAIQFMNILEKINI